MNKKLEGPFYNPDPERSDEQIDFCKYWVVSLRDGIIVSLRHFLTECHIRHPGMDLSDSKPVTTRYGILTQPH
jgi:hypothetical protein